MRGACDPKPKNGFSTSISDCHVLLKLKSELGIPSESEPDTLQSWQNLDWTEFELVAILPAELGRIEQY